MLGNPLGDKEEDQRMWNFLLLKIPLTDKEIEALSPGFTIISLFLILAIIYILF